ncbi:MAG: ATP-binding protein [Sphingomonas sp.]|jgi:signal transduction histidine kinase|uniref:sensor histidine kinase n=1 Tax=Sphingomonas sp. TaxID=28214 RepID=UPI0035653D36
MQRGTLPFRIAVVLVIGFVALQLGVFVLTSLSVGGRSNRTIGLPTTQQTQTMLDMIEAAPAARRPAIAGAFDGALYHVLVENGALPPSIESLQGMDIGQAYSAALPGHNLSVTGRVARMPSFAALNPWAGWISDPLAIHIALAGKRPSMLTIVSQPSEPILALLRQRAGLLGFGGLVALIALALAVRATTRPIVRLARDIRTFAGRPETPDLIVSGSPELRDLAHAYNDMKARIAELMGERTRILAAIAHDMRTYLTRLRLRADFIDDEEQQQRAIHDLDEMSALLNDTLLLARPEQPCCTDPRILDLSAEIARMAAIHHELGDAVTVGGCAENAWAEVSPLALRRILANLIDNGLRHGSNVTLAVDREPARWRIAVSDDGPGVPAAEIGRLGRAFGRIDPSRDRATGGAGLGLAIVRALVQAQDGEIAFANAAHGGLAISIWFKIARDPDDR